MSHERIKQHFSHFFVTGFSHDQTCKRCHKVAPVVHSSAVAAPTTASAAKTQCDSNNTNLAIVRGGGDEPRPSPAPNYDIHIQFIIDAGICSDNRLIRAALIANDGNIERTMDYIIRQRNRPEDNVIDLMSSSSPSSSPTPEPPVITPPGSDSNMSISPVYSETNEENNSNEFNFNSSDSDDIKADKACTGAIRLGELNELLDRQVECVNRGNCIILISLYINL